MKKLLFIVLVAMIGLQANAQLVRSRSYQAESGYTKWFIRGGLSLNTFSGDFNDYVSVGFKPGYEASVGFKHFFKKSKLYMGAELGVGTRGFKADDKKADPDDYYKYSLNLTQLKLPVFVGINYALTEDFSLDAHVGPFFSYDLAGKSTKDIYYEGEYEDDYSSSTTDVTKKFDTGLAIGAGIQYDHVLFDITYQHGFIKTDGFTSSNILFRVGYMF